MKKILLVYPPFCTAAIPPYSIANLYGFLRKNADDFKIEVLDLNIFFHKKMFPEYHRYYKALDKSISFEEYDEKTKEFLQLTKKTYSENNKKVVEGETPSLDLFDESINEIVKKKPDFVAFSVVYSSQTFYTYSLLAELKKRSIKTIIGGPAVNKKLIDVADKYLRNEIELIEYLCKKGHDKVDFEFYPEFDAFNLEDYFVKEPVIPIKTSSTCYYQQCAFCTHHGKGYYFEYPLEKLKKTIVESGQKNFFFVDDMIHKKRLLEIAQVLKPLNVRWTCQLKPTKDLDLETMRILNESGLKIITWGVESGNDRILSLMKKGTNKKDIAQVLKDSHDAGIRNSLYIMFGFPTETKDEFLDTINFLKENDGNIDLVWTSVFGLQKDSPVYNNPKEFGITQIHEKKRTILEPKISYEIKSGLTQEEAANMRKKYKKTLENINKYPKEMNFFREHMFAFID